MKNKTAKALIMLVLLVAFSCDEPETIVTDIVHTDGSVTRKIEMRNKEKKFKTADLRVPFDSTWLIRDSISVNEKRDTTWIKTAEKYFASVDEINTSYSTDKGSNREFSRKAVFVKKFRWFNTEFRFSERLDKILSNGYPIKDFLNNEELTWFFSPESLNKVKLDGPDSLKYKVFDETISKKTEKWTVKNFVSEWIYEFTTLTAGGGGNDLSREALKARVDEFVSIIERDESKFDSLWEKGVILKEMIGEANASRYKVEADSALSKVTESIFSDFKNYSVRIVMPGKVIGTNGFLDKTEILIWPVKADYFMTEPYEMWAESKIVNAWAWIVTGIFVLFVITGLLIRLFRKNGR